MPRRGGRLSRPPSSRLSQVQPHSQQVSADKQAASPTTPRHQHSSLSRATRVANPSSHCFLPPTSIFHGPYCRADLLSRPSHSPPPRPPHSVQPTSQHLSSGLRIRLRAHRILLQFRPAPVTTLTSDVDSSHLLGKSRGRGGRVALAGCDIEEVASPLKRTNIPRAQDGCCAGHAGHATAAAGQ